MQASCSAFVHDDVTLKTFRSDRRRCNQTTATTLAQAFLVLFFVEGIQGGGPQIGFCGAVSP